MAINFPNLQEQAERQCFGETVEEMLAAKPEFVSNAMYAMQILSDVQEVLRVHDVERARQWINKAKYFLSQGVNKEVKS